MNPETSELPLGDKLRLLAKWFDSVNVQDKHPEWSDRTEVQDDLTRAAVVVEVAAKVCSEWEGYDLHPAIDREEAILRLRRVVR